MNLKKLVDASVIEVIESTDWLAHIVVVRKPDKSIRLCVNLRDLNSAIWVDRHPFPNIN